MYLRFLVLAVVAAWSNQAAAQTVTRALPNHEALVMSRHLALPLSAGTTTQAMILPRALEVTTVAVWVYSGGGGGAGSSVMRLTDGTNNCDCTMLCTDSASIGARRSVCSGSCVFAAGVQLSLSTLTAGCTTTQPSVISTDVRGRWR